LFFVFACGYLFLNFSLHQLLYLTPGRVNILTSDKISVDEPLISTDVDSLIRAIAERKKISLNDLRKVSGIDKKNMDKWISVLEDEGYISVEYGIRGTFIHWQGEVETAEYVKEDPQEVPYEQYETYHPVSEDVPDQEEPDLPETPGPEKRDENEFTHSMPLEETEEAQETNTTEDENTSDTVSKAEEADPEDMLSEYLAKKRNGHDPEVEEATSQLIASLEENDSVSDEPEDTDPGIDFSKITDDDHTEAPEEPQVAYEAPEETLQPTAQSDKVAASDIRELMGTYMQEINKEKAAIHLLKKEKDNLYRDKISSLEGRMQADLVVLTEKIIEKQNRLAQLKEHVLELPDKVDEVEKVQQAMDQLKDESRAALERTRKKADEYISGVTSSRDEVKERIEDINSSIEEQSHKLAELERVSDSLDIRSQQLRKTVEETQEKIDEINSAMSSLSSDLEVAEEAKSNVTEMRDSIKDTVASHGEELESLEGELDDIAKVEHYVVEYIRDYEAKIQAIEDYISQSDDELVALRESSESLYIKKYLNELSDLTDAYESGLDEALSSEKSIDEKIFASKQRITELVTESKEMMRKLQGEVSDSDDYGTILTNVKKRTSRTKRVVAEKQSERDKLSQDSKNARKSKRSDATKAASAKVRARKKAKKKKKK
jgi:methyl-accepting chemotaxis protein